jgi:hypothetical protein
MPNAIFETQNSLEFDMYPNPVRGDFVRFSKAISCRVFNTSGKMVFSGQEIMQLKVSDYGKGLYIIVTDDGISKKLCIQ